MSKATRTSGAGSTVVKRRTGRNFSVPTWVLGLIGVIFFGVAIFAGVILFQVVEEMVATGPFASGAANPPDPVADPNNPIQPAQPGNEEPEVQPENGETPVLPTGIRPADRVTILLLGIDQPCEHIDEPYRSDTMILLTIDPLSKTAGVLSIPRDLWVPIPGFDTNRINTAFRFGEIYEYPGGGPQLAIETVQYNLGVHIQHYLTVNYDGFIQAIDVIGGIDIEAPEAINDPDYPDRCFGYDPFYLGAGNQHLNGEDALKYARTRATHGVDFDRAERQQVVMMAVLKQVMDQNVTLLTRSPELWMTFEENVTTSMSYQEAVGLALLAMEIPPENIHRAVIDYNYVRDYTAPDGQRVLIPIRERIRDLRDLFFSAGVAPTPEDLLSQVRTEAANVMVLNGTWTSGLAGGTADLLETKGLIVAGVGDAENKNLAETQIIDYSDKPATVNYLAQLLNVPPKNIFSSSDANHEHDIELVLGADWQLPDD